MPFVGTPVPILRAITIAWLCRLKLCRSWKHRAIRTGQVQQTQCSTSLAVGPAVGSMTGMSANGLDQLMSLVRFPCPAPDAVRVVFAPSLGLGSWCSCSGARIAWFCAVQQPWRSIGIHAGSSRRSVTCCGVGEPHGRCVEREHSPGCSKNLEHGGRTGCPLACVHQSAACGARVMWDALHEETPDQILSCSFWLHRPSIWSMQPTV